MRTGTDAISLGDLSDVAMENAVPLMHEVFESYAHAYPTREALVSELVHYSYGQLNERVNQFSRYLAYKGVGRHSRVGIWLEPHADRVVCLLAILKLGAVACPIHPTVPPDMLETLLVNIDAKLLLSRHEKIYCPAKEEKISLSCDIVELDSMHNHIDVQATTDLLLSVEPSDTAYIIHTSGSTGIPKPVAMSHAAFSFEIRWQIMQSRNHAPLKTLQLASLGFDVFLTETLSTLCNGGTLVIASNEVRNSAASLYSCIEHYQIQRLLISRVALQRLAEEVFISDNEEPPKSLMEIMSTGEQLRITPELRYFFNDLECQFYNEYGMSENPVVATYALEGDPEGWPDKPPAGKLAKGADVYVLHEDLTPVSIGEEGELFIGGKYLADGYVNREKDNQHRFIKNPFGEGLLLRSGDIGVMSATKEITLIGRNDGIVKIRGIRVGLGEIEDALKTYTNVKDAVVIKDDSVPDGRLVAYVILVHSEQGYESVLRKFLMDLLPPHAIPAFFMELHEYPLTFSGKVDRRALPAIGSDRPNIDTEFVAAESYLEREMVHIWSDILQIDNIGVRDNIFDLGGNSLTVTDIVKQINRKFKADIETTAVFQFPTIKTITEHLSELIYGSREKSVSPAVPKTMSGDSVAQRRRKRRAQFQRQLPGGGEINE